ncbi:NlpC/P60 family protein [Streptomyces sp. SCL15-6]|uniref:C40 family peptidase n=1 Tax=Streptomyces sp. SCL15-6 TaxID=2967222 RepID=UPI0029669A9B|nr:NlpC/P60 family protein [Streptomyces sp. SCL15-6]
MTQQTQLPPPVRSHRKPTPKRSARPVLRLPRRPRVRNARTRRIRSFVWGAAGLAVALVLSLLAGALLAVHGPSPSSADGPSVILQPKPPTGAEPVTVTPAEPDPTTESVNFKKVTLRPGATLWGLAQTHGTSVMALQRLNHLGSSTLIYAGKTLKVPAGTDTAGSVRQPKATQPRTTSTPDAQPSPRSTHEPAAGAKSAPDTVIAYAKNQLGKPYVWGGTGPRGFDCSGLVMRAWETAGVKLPRTTWGQIRAGSATTRGRLVPGDLVLSYGGGHVGLYIGKGRVIHAPRPGTTVTVAPLPAPGDVVAYRHIRA